METSSLKILLLIETNFNFQNEIQATKSFPQIFIMNILITTNNKCLFDNIEGKVGIITIGM